MVGQGVEKSRTIKNRALPHIAPGLIIPLATGLGSTLQKSLLCQPTNSDSCFVKRNATCAASTKKIQKRRIRPGLGPMEIYSGDFERIDNLISGPWMTPTLCKPPKKKERSTLNGTTLSSKNPT